MKSKASKARTSRGKRTSGKKEEELKSASRGSFPDSDYNCQKSKPNDWRWYAQNDKLLNDTASFPYNWPLGTKLNLGETAADVNAGSVPGVMAIQTAPAFGWANEQNSPINVAARNIYSFVRHANSGHANYDAVDEMLYLMAMDSCYSYIEFLKRVYGVAMTYSYTNRYYPKAIINAMGVSFSDIQMHLADFRAGINVLAVKVGSLCVPASMSVFAKHMWMYQGYYLDDNQDKAQTYMFVPNGFFQYGLDQDGAGQLSYLPLGQLPGGTKPQVVDDSTLLTYSDLLTYGNALLDPILQSEDMNIMSGDILKAFGAGNLYQVAGLAETYTVLPSYDQEVLSQIENATLIGSYYQDEAILHQSDDKGYLVFTPWFAHPYAFDNNNFVHPGYNVYVSDNFVNFHHGDINPADTMVATRMSNISRLDLIDYENNRLQYHTLGTEVAMCAHIYYYSMWTTEWELTRSRTVYQANTGVINFTNATNMVDLAVDIYARISTPEMKAGKISDTPFHMTTVDGTMPTMSLPIVTTDPTLVVPEIMQVFLLAEQISNFDWHPAMSLTLGIVGQALQGATFQADINSPGAFYTIWSNDTTYVDACHLADTFTLTPQAQEWFKEMPVYGRYNGLLFDLAYYTVVTEQNLINMAQTALLSEFNVTQYGRKN